MPIKTLPTFYYLEHLKEFLEHLIENDAALLTDNHHKWITTFNNLPHDAQCIVARSLNRKYRLIAKRSLDYPEIKNIQSCISELESIGWFARVNNDSIDEAIMLLTKPELSSLLDEYSPRKVKKSVPKSELQQALISLPERTKLLKAKLFDEYVIRTFDIIFDYFLFIYFGHTKGKLNQFSMRDLGIMRTRSDSQNGGTRFNHKKEAESAFFYAKLREQIRNTIEKIALNELPSANGELASRYRDECLTLIAKHYLTRDEDYAMRALSMAQSDVAREKWLRERYRQGAKDAVFEELNRIIEQASSETLLVFAEDFLARKYQKKRTSRLTDMLRNATQTLCIDQLHINRVEQGVIEHYKRKNIIAKRTENDLWRVFFGLMFWDIIYDVDSKTLVNEFDIRPNVLVENRLYQDHAERIEQRLQRISDNNRVKQYLTSVATQHYGKSNSIFRWHKRILDDVLLLCQHIDYQQWSSLLRAMSKDYRSLSDGFPDIMVIEKGQLRFEEIKAPGDQLRRNQLITLDKMRDVGFTIYITAVQWYRDPEQPYAVVDIETTGGKSSTHRITEIGIVKLVNGVIIDRWESLINPNRHIPASITRLTGIDNDMVANAPSFDQIADAIEKFTEGCIFVAHNVNFDYGFIKQEFERLGRFYRRPKLCTVRETRRIFPGLTSYSLANLTAYFQIQMNRHHRAMSDAEATAELLKLIHNKEHQSELSVDT